MVGVVTDQPEPSRVAFRLKDPIVTDLTFKMFAENEMLIVTG
jgi:hypothetical protein